MPPNRPSTMFFSEQEAFVHFSVQVKGGITPAEKAYLLARLEREREGLQLFHESFDWIDLARELIQSAPEPSTYLPRKGPE